MSSANFISYKYTNFSPSPPYILKKVISKYYKQKSYNQKQKKYFEMSENNKQSENNK